MPNHTGFCYKGYRLYYILSTSLYFTVKYLLYSFFLKIVKISEKILRIVFYSQTFLSWIIENYLELLKTILNYFVTLQSWVIEVIWVFWYKENLNIYFMIFATVL